jgi:hypothetical protein
VAESPSAAADKDTAYIVVTESVELIIAISHRFKQPSVLELYEHRVKPVLTQFGKVISCDHASNTAGDLDYWMNRMNVVLDLADIHVFVDVDRSANTFYEWYSSNLSCQYGPGVSLEWHFGITPPIIERPLQIIIYTGAEATAGLFFINVATRLFQHIPLRTDTGPGVLEQALAQALRDRSRSLGESRSSQLKQPSEPDKLSAAEYWQFRNKIANRIASGASLSDLTAEFTRAIQLLEGMDPEEIRKSLQLLEGYKASILAYNQDLSDLSASCAKAMTVKPRFGDVFAYTKQMLELGLISAALRSVPNYASVKQIHRYFRYPFARQMWNVFVFKKALKMRRELRSFGARNDSEGPSDNPLSRLLWSAQKRLRGSVILRTFLRLLVPAAWVVIFTIWLADRIPVGQAFVRIVVLTLVTGMIVVSVAASRFAKVPPRELTGRRYRWLVLENPKAIRFIHAIKVAFGILIMLWLGFVALSWLARFVPGGQTTILVIVGVLLAALIARVITRLVEEA